MIMKCIYYPDLSNTPRALVEARLRALEGWGTRRNWPQDPRCGCAAPDGVCEWDSVAALEDLL